VSSLTGLTVKQVAVLDYILKEHLLGVYDIDGGTLARHMDTSPQGVHQTAASLVRKRALSKVKLPRMVTYNITQHGISLAMRERKVHGVKS
jgi:DNA-binding MarR family transcriptional regulator